MSIDMSYSVFSKVKNLINNEGSPKPSGGAAWLILVNALWLKWCVSVPGWGSYKLSLNPSALLPSLPSAKEPTRASGGAIW